MSDISKVINPFKRAEETLHEFSLAEVGVTGVSEAEKQQIVHNMDETLVQAEVILNEAA